MEKHRRLMRFSLLRALLCILAAGALTPLLALAGLSWENGQIAVAGFSLVAATLFGCVVWGVIDAIAMKRFHFGLRTLMAAITLLAVLLAVSGRWAVRVRKEAGRRSEAIETLSKFGAWLYFGMESDPGVGNRGWAAGDLGMPVPNWLRTPFLDSYLSRLVVVRIDVSFRPVSASDIAQIADAIKVLPGSRDLYVQLELRSSKIGLEELKQLSEVPGLGRLNVVGNQLNDDCVEYLLRLRLLKELLIYDNFLSPAAVEDLQHRRPRLQVFSDYPQLLSAESFSPDAGGAE